MFFVENLQWKYLHKCFLAPGSYITHDATWLPVYSEIVEGHVLK